MYQMCQRLNCSYRDLQEMPEELHDLFRAFLQGEGRAAADRAKERDTQARVSAR